MPKQKQNDVVHEPVLLKEVLHMLDPKVGDVYLDLTAGYGGHASEIVKLTQAPATLVDRDNNAITALQELFNTAEVSLMNQDFLSASAALVEHGKKYDIILADLGVSSPHLDIANRGFSINKDGPLDMRMDQSQETTAADLLNTAEESELIRILREYGEEPKAKRIANLIVENRPLETTHQLAAIVKQAWPGYSRSHPATRTFQAVRIAVNDELGQVERALPLWLQLLKPGGRLGVISFHSLEDAAIKRYFKEHGGNRYDAQLSILTQRPLSASADELVTNPRARSAKLRVATLKRK
jgi:16S rRNA (cytosine1402-N4)-methyltransferase